jgi:hypothetical protein
LPSLGIKKITRKTSSKRLREDGYRVNDGFLRAQVSTRAADDKDQGSGRKPAIAETVDLFTPDQAWVNRVSTLLIFW